MMYRLGLRLTVRSGREPFVRLVVTAAAVAVGVAIMLGVLADFHAFTTENNRPAWESTRGQSAGGNYRAAARSELWNYGNDIYRGQTIERLDVAALGPHAPVPPGISRLPGAGQYYASPALAALIRSVPRDELGARFPGALAGTIGRRALTGPDELVIYIGYAPARLAALPATKLVTAIATAPGRNIWTHYFRDAFVAGAIAFLFPILILIGTATRLAAARREERYAALRLAGATSAQTGVIASVDAVISALLGALAGIAVFLALQPWLASTAITSQRFFASEVTPTATGYLIVLSGVPAASALSSVLSLQRVRISPLGVTRRMTPRAPSAWGLAPLAAGVALFIIGLQTTSKLSIGPAMPTGLIVILIGLVIAGPWLTARAAALAARFIGGASALLAARRIGDNPKAAFRSVRGLVLAVFLGTVLAGLLPAVEAVTATPSATALRNVLLDAFVATPVCGNNVNCTGGGPGGLPVGTGSSQRQKIGVLGLPPAAGSALLHGLGQFRGATVIPVYSLPQDLHAGAGPGFEPTENDAVISCTGLRVLGVLGQCGRGLRAVKVSTANMIYSDNPHYSTQPIAGPSSPAASPDMSKLYLQAVLVKVNSAATLERVRTFLVTHTAQSASGTAPRTFGEAVQARAAVTDTIRRLLYLAVTLTLVVAGCSLAVSVGGSLTERKRPFTLLRVTGTPTSTLYRVVLGEAVLPLAAATLIAAGVGYLIAVLTVGRLAPAGTPVPVPGHTYFLTMGAGLLGALLVILAALPLLRRITSPETVRFE